MKKLKKKYNSVRTVTRVITSFGTPAENHGLCGVRERERIPRTTTDLITDGARGGRTRTDGRTGFEDNAKRVFT